MKTLSRYTRRRSYVLGQIAIRWSLKLFESALEGYLFVSCLFCLQSLEKFDMVEKILMCTKAASRLLACTVIYIFVVFWLKNSHVNAFVNFLFTEEVSRNKLVFAFKLVCFHELDMLTMLFSQLMIPPFTKIKRIQFCVYCYN